MRAVAVALVGMLVLLAGCYALQPVGGMNPETGSRFAFEVTDAGRIALEPFVGPAVDQIEGRLLSAENGEYAVAVSQIRYLRGSYQTWTGERVNIKKEHVARTYERRFSKGRTVMLAATVVGVAALVFGTDLLGFGGESQPIRNDSTLPEFRVRRP